MLSNFGKEVSAHTFDIPSDNTRSYTLRSIHAFRSRERAELVKALEQMANTASDKIIHPEWSTYVQAGDGIDPYMYMFRDWPRTHHASLWDLYKAIGYDYKKQRYVK
jgi:hypothetical protein